MHLTIILSAIFIAYLFGSISSAIIICKVMGLPDPRTQGSRNPGATNVLRIGGKIPAAITLFGDVLKGFIPVVLARWYGLDSLVISFVAIAAFCGHLFPIFFAFEGGKGVATFLGCLFAICWPAGVGFFACWFVVVLITHYVSLASLLAALCTPLFLWYFTQNTDFVLAFAVLSLLLIIRHKENIQKIIAGNENKLGKHKKV